MNSDMYSDIEDIEVEDTSVILARRKKEDELSARMQELITNFDKYLEEKEKSSAEDDKQEVDKLVHSICKSGQSDLQESCMINLTFWKPTESVLTAEHCFCIFSADTLSLSRFPQVDLAECKSCERLCMLGTWQELLSHIDVFAQKTYMHNCAVTAAFPRFLFFLMSVCDDGLAVRRFYHALCACWFESPLTLDDILTVFYNWGFNKTLMNHSFGPSPEFQGRRPKRERHTNSKMAASSAEQKHSNSKSDFPVDSMAVNDTLKFILLKLPELKVSLQNEDKALTVLRMFTATLADGSIDFATHQLQLLVYKMLDCLEIDTWPEEKFLKLITTLHIREFSVFGQYACVRALVDRPVHDDRSALKGCVAWAILQVLHGVEPDKVVYMTRLRPDYFTELPPGPVPYSRLQPGQLYLSLQILGDCVSSVAPADAEDPSFYGSLLRHMYQLQQQQLPRMSVMDSNIIKCLIGHLDFLWKSITNDLLEKQGQPNSLLSYMRDLLQH